MGLVDFYKNKRILITGNTGFKGSWLSLWLKELGAEVLGYSLESPVSQPNLFSAASLNTIIETKTGDIRNFSCLEETIKKFQPEIIFHMAAQSLVKDSYSEPLYTFETNVMGTANLLQASKSSNALRVIINVTSDKCYENNESAIGFCENDRLGGLDPYSSSKACAELVSKSFSNSFFLESDIKLANVRAGNVIGGGDWANNRLVPDIYRSLHSKSKIILRSPNALRPWQHVLEPISGYLRLAKILFDKGNFQTGNNWNFGPNDTDIKSVKEVVDMFKEINPDISYEVKKESFHESQVLKLNISKAKEELNWHPLWSVNEAINNTNSWYEGFYIGEDIRVVTLKQILAYQNLTF